MKVTNECDLKDEILKVTFIIGLVLAAFIASNIVNYLYMEYNNLAINHRYKMANSIENLSIYITRINEMYRFEFSLLYFKSTILNLYAMITILSCLSLICFQLKQTLNKRLTFYCLLVLLTILLTVPLLVNLPLITGNDIPIRAHFTMGWLIAGAFLLLSNSTMTFLKTINTLLATTILIFSVLYINVFFEASSRQTASDITLANQIVNRIRLNENYTQGPLQLYIIGEKATPVIGWHSYQQALNTNWSKYKIFSIFTDLNFTRMSEVEYQKVRTLIIRNGQPLSVYPASNSIFIHQDKVLLFLDVKSINTLISM